MENTGTSLFLTGKAGTGKTTFLHEVDERSVKRHVVVAPTGVAAVNAGGVTIHSFFQLPFEPYLPEVKELVTEYQAGQRSMTKSKLATIRSLELLIIDEISMVRADLLDAIDMVLRQCRHSSRPFGGVQLLMIGDVHQLPPVVTEHERPYLERVYRSPFFFESKALQQLPYVTIELQHVFRQQDACFVDLLNAVRQGRMDPPVLAALNSRLGRAPEGAIVLTTHNRQADAINAAHMQALQGESRTMEALVSGTFPQGSMPVDEHLALKVGERVMFAKNDSSGEHNYYNGKLGNIVGFESGDDGEEARVLVVDDEGDTVEVGREVWENVRYVTDTKDGTISQEVEGRFVQYPLRPAWAVTIHKAQGLTFDRVAVDAAEAFAFGQVYVALSRCRTLEGLTLTSPLSAGVAVGDAGVEAFCQSRPTLQQVEAAVDDCERQYYYERLAETFSMAGVQHDVERVYEAYGKVRGIFEKKYAAMQALYNHVLELATVGEKFVRQLMSTTPEQHKERVPKGSAYFLEQLKGVQMALTALLDVDIDNKAHAKLLRESGAAARETIRQKILRIEGPGTDNKVEKPKAAKVRKEAAPKAPKQPRAPKETVPVETDARSEELVRLLSLWRRSKAEELDVKPFMVLHQKTLVAIVEARPKTEAELLKIDGIGPTKARLYGTEILDIVNS